MAEPSDPDDELLARLGRGDPHAARTLVDRKLGRVLALAQRLLGHRGEAEEVAQETLLRAWKQASRWRSGGARFDTWLHRVALNLCNERLRSPRRQREQAVDVLPDLADTAPDPAERLAQAQGSDGVARALAALPHRQREALVLQYYQELSQADAAGLMGISIEALESLLARARRNLRAELLGHATPSTSGHSPP